MSDISVDDAPLAGYQERRLAELTAVVEARSSTARRTFPRKRPVLAAVGAACAIGIGVLAWPGSAPAAYAVTRQPSGLVTVKVTQHILDSGNAAALSRELRSLGVPAAVFSIPAGKMCPQPYARTAALPADVYQMPQGIYTVPSDLPEKDGGGWKMTINPGHFKPGQFLVWVLTTSGVYGTSSSGMAGPSVAGSRLVGMAPSTATYLADGRLIPCHPRPWPGPKDPGRGGDVLFANS